MLQDKALAFDFDIRPVILCIEPNAWIVCTLLVVVDHPVLVEFGRRWIAEDRLEVGIFVEILMKLVGVHFILPSQSPATGAVDTDRASRLGKDKSACQEEMHDYECESEVVFGWDVEDWH